MNGKMAIVTGTSRGIGKAVALTLLKNGYITAGCSRSGSDIDHENYMDFTLDITDPAAVKDAVKSIAGKTGRIDVLVNNAGTSHLGRLTDDNFPEDVLRLFKTNVIGALHFMREVIPVMNGLGGGYIINIGSLRGGTPMPGKFAYGSTKATLKYLGEVAALENPDIRVSTISPGFTYTELIKFRIEKEKLTPEDVVCPEDIGATVMYLLNLPKAAGVGEIEIGKIW